MFIQYFCVRFVGEWRGLFPGDNLFGCFQTQITTLCVATSMNATVALVCLYSPKVYIIVLHPDKNVRKLTMNSAAYKKYNSGPTSTYTASSTHKGWSNCKLAKSILLRPTYFLRSFVQLQYFFVELLEIAQKQKNSRLATNDQI
jgi:hypothetical protein